MSAIAEDIQKRLTGEIGAKRVGRAARAIDEGPSHLLPKEDALAVQPIERGHQRGVGDALERGLQIADALRAFARPQGVEHTHLERTEETLELVR